MSTNTLQEVQATLAKSGVHDVKFFFAPGVMGARDSATVEKVKSDAIKVLNCYLDGNLKPLPAFGDALTKI